MKFLEKTLEYDNVNHQVIIKDEKNKEKLRLFWQLAQIREDSSQFITEKEYLECLSYYADIDDTYDIPKAVRIHNKLYAIFGLDLWEDLHLPY